MTPSRLAALAAACLCWSFLGSAPAMAQTPDPMQRFFVFKNDTPLPIYPVISAPRNANCTPGDLSSLRIVVNDGQVGAGIGPGASVTVALPKEYPCLTGGFYNASRVYVLLANVAEFEATIDPRQRTFARTDGPRNLCAGDACWVGDAQADYVGDFPGQLLEYTIISQIGGSPSPNGPNDPKGVSVIDFDVSYVDHAYLPVAMAIADGLTAYMGSALPYEEFKLRLTTFLKDPRTDWSAYGVYADRNWVKQTVFGPGQDPGLNLDKIDKLPSGNVVVVSSRPESVGFSPYYAGDSAVPPASYQFPACNDGVHNLACSLFNNLKSGNCCPAPSSTGQLEMEGCCDVKNFLVDRTLATYVKSGTDPNGNPIAIYTFSNPTFTNIVHRWEQWRKQAYQCVEGAPPPTTPAVDAVDFCSMFQRTVDFVWDEFVQRGNCGGGIVGDALNQCVVAAILGYDLKAADPKKCAACPALPCPAECVTDIQLNQGVQALMRGVPWTPAGDAFNSAKCGKCPSANPLDCSLECVAPAVYSPNATLWHLDKFLQSWAPYDSPYNLNPFDRFVHVNDPVKTEGLDAPGAYAFSIDDFYGNFGARGSTLVINVGGTSALINKSAYDPYTQYFVGIAPGWYSAEVCGRDISLPDPASGLGTNVPFSFWAADGSGRQTSCEITLFADATKQEYVKFKVDELQYAVHDNYTNQDHQVYGLCGVFAVRGGQHLTVHDNEYCCQNSTSDLAGRGKCQANMTPGFLNLAYVAVTECDDPNDSTCGRPLMTLAVPALPGGAPNTACKPPVPPSIACKAVTGAPPTLVASLLPSSHAVQVGVPATFFATIINAGTSEASQVGIALASIQSQALLTFNATACASNAVIGGDNVRVNIAAGDRACFVVRLTAIGALGPTEVSFTFAGTNTTPAPTLPGVNTLMLVASTTPAPDLVALVVTATGDGILTLAGPAGSGAFSVATANVGASALITATANTHGLNLPLTVLICESDPVTAACKATPAGSVTAQANGGQTLTFSVFALAEGPVAFDPAVNRIFVEWSLGGVLVGRTSVAVRTL